MVFIMSLYLRDALILLCCDFVCSFNRATGGREGDFRRDSDPVCASDAAQGRRGCYCGATPVCIRQESDRRRRNQTMSAERVMGGTGANKSTEPGAFAQLHALTGSRRWMVKVTFFYSLSSRTERHSVSLFPPYCFLAPPASPFPNPQAAFHL